jgi:hypothetical protein
MIFPWAIPPSPATLEDDEPPSQLLLEHIVNQSDKVSPYSACRHISRSSTVST